MSNPHPSPGSRPLEQLKVAELRDELRKRGLSLKGVKKDLFERLDEAVRKEQADTLPSALEVVEDQHKGVHGLEDEHGIAHSAGHPHFYNSSETVQDGDGLVYLNDGENPLQDSALIVNNASPYVGASDATPVFMEPRKDMEKLNTGFGDDVPSINNMNSSSVPESLNVDTEDVSRPDNLVLENNAVCPAVENVAVIPEPDKQASGNETILPCKEDNDVDLPEDSHQASDNDVDLPEDSHQASGNDVVLPEFVSQACENDGLLAVPKVIGPTDDTLSTRNCAPGRDDAIVGEIVTVVQKSGDADVTTQGEVAIPSETVKDVASTSVSDDLLSVADASLPASNCVVIANDSPVQDAEVIEKTVLTSVNVVPCVQESVEDGSGGCLKIETSEVVKDNLLVEETKQVESLEGGEASMPTSAVREALEAPPGVAIVEAVQDPILQEVQQDIAVPESLQDSIMHEGVQDLVVQEVRQDTEMSEALESPIVKMEVSEMASDTKPLAVSLDAPDLPVDIKSENRGNLNAADSNRPNEAVMVVDEGKPNVKLEPMEAESRAGRRMVPVENVKVEQQDIKEDLPKSGRSFDRPRPKESEYERSRHESVRASTYGNERSRAEGRSGRVFREERRKEPKERNLKPDEEEFHDRSSQKRKDDDRDANQQEPAKRMRRWNSGNQLVVETATPLTTGIVKDITSPVKKEGFAVAPPKLTPKFSGPSRPILAPAKTNSEANGDKRAVPPSTRPPTPSLKVERFVRPFTLKAGKDVLSEFGECADFWMDQIKTHCYVTYSKVDEAVAARNGLYDKQWPPSFGNLLVADFVDPSEVKMRSDGTFEKMKAPPVTTPRGISNQPLAQGAQPPGSFHGHSNSLASAPPLRERQLMQVPMKDPEPPVPTLDDLFRKTKTKPHIYYLPLTDEQVAEKLAAVKNKEQQQARSKPLGRV